MGYTSDVSNNISDTTLYFWIIARVNWWRFIVIDWERKLNDDWVTPKILNSAIKLNVLFSIQDVLVIKTRSYLKYNFHGVIAWNYTFDTFLIVYCIFLFQFNRSCSWLIKVYVYLPPKVNCFLTSPFHAGTA